MEKGTEIIYIVLFGAVIMLGIALLVISFVTSHRKKYLKQQNELQRIEHEKEQNLLKAIIIAQEEERNRIARNLHDSVGAELSMLKLNFSQYLYFMNDTEIEKSKFKNELNNLDQTIETVSSVCKNLYPLTLQNYGLIKTFEDLIKRIDHIGLITCEFETTISNGDLGDDYDKLLNLYRVFQEVLNNLIKHSACTYLKVHLTKKDGFLDLKIEHNGRLFTNENVEILLKQNKGIGLSSIQNRINLLKGSIDYASNDHKSLILIKLPN